MSDRSPAEIRLELARGHWSLDEHEEAIDCLLRIVTDAPETPGLAELIGKYVMESQDARLAAAHERLCLGVEKPESGSPLHTATMAQLLADQGHESRALQVATDAVNRNPDDDRARALRERLVADAPGKRERQVEALESWLASIRERGHRGVRA